MGRRAGKTQVNISLKEEWEDSSQAYLVVHEERTVVLAPEFRHAAVQTLRTLVEQLLLEVEAIQTCKEN